MRNCPPTQTPEVDREALHARYLAECDKRLRPEGQNQYLEADHQFADYYEADPHTPVEPGEPTAADLEVVVLGGGFIPG